MRAGNPRKGQERVKPQQISVKYTHAVFFDDAGNERLRPWRLGGRYGKVINGREGGVAGIYGSRI
jgi:hypothetical protein